jgi:hypothetical protein
VVSNPQKEDIAVNELFKLNMLRRITERVYGF